MPYGFKEDKSKFNLDDINYGKLKKNRNLIFIGDSYQVGNYSGASFTSFVTLFKQRYGNEFGEIYNKEMGSYGFAANGVLLFIQLLRQLENTILDKTKITDIIVTGGYNDWQNPSGVGAGIQEFMNYCDITYQNAEVWLAPVAALRSANAEKAYNAMVNWKVEGAKYGANVIQGIETCLRCGEYLMSENVHPNQAGQDVLCNALYTGIRTGSYNHIKATSTTGFTVDSQFESASYLIYSDQHGNTCNLYNVEPRWFNYKSAKTVNADGNTPICLGSVQRACTYGDNWSANYEMGSFVNALARNGTGNTFKNLPSLLYVWKGKLYLVPYCVEEGGQYKKFSTKTIILPSFRLTVDNTRG